MKPLCCLLLGSGFSNALAGFPTQAGFLRCILRDQKQLLEGHVPWAKGHRLSQWMRKVGDVETAMSVLHNFAYSPIACSETRLVAKKAIVNLRTAIAQQFAPRSPEGSYQEKRAIFAQWLKRWQCNARLVILTTNYDRVIEDTLSPRSHPWLCPDVPLVPRNNGTPLYTPNGLDLYKLHGSIDWLERRELKIHELTGVRPLRIWARNTRRKPLVKDGWWGFHLCRTDDDPRGVMPVLHTPILVPFFFQKEAWLSERWAPVLQRHWDSAFRRLSTHRVDRLAIIGTSFPQADHYLLSWILRLLHGKSFDNARRNKIVISCRDATYSVRQRLGLDARNSNTTALSLEDLRS
jgi:hypothetical protein